jgi:adenylate cyclase
VPAHLLRQALPVTNDRVLHLSDTQGIIPPLESFATSAAGVGIINVGEGREAIVRRMPLLDQLKGKYYPNLALCTWMRYTGNLELLSFQRKGLQVDSLIIPMDKKGNFMINWYGKGDAGGVFHYYSYAAALQSAVASIYESGDPVLQDGLFKDKYVIIGAKAAGLMDLKSSPYTWSVPGMEIWATILSNLNQQDFVSIAHPAINWLITFCIVFLTLLCVTRLKSGLASLILILMLLFTYAGSAVLFSQFRYLFSLTIPTFAFLITWIFIVTISYMMEGKHKKELRMIFSRYIHPDLVQRIVDHPDMVQMGGNEYQATVMFSDIYNFTGFSENKSPTELVSYLNEYFSSFTNSILDFNGLLDKYTGDGLMAVFGVPIARTDHALSACKAAMAHRDYSLQFKGLPDLTPSQQFHLNTRLGIHSGTLVAGNIGSERRMEYTSIGDTVNLSARLEGVNKVFKTYIIISEATYLQVKDQMLCRELDFLRVKGKKEPTRIYELVAEKSALPTHNHDYSWIDSYESALQLYRDGDWQQAAAIFGSLSTAPLSDSASATMLSRCEYLLANPPETWDGILTLEEK